MREKYIVPWNPDRSLADFFIVMLLSVILFLVGSQPRCMRDGVRSLDDIQVTVNGRIEDAILGASNSLYLPFVSSKKKSDIFTKAVNNCDANNWDKALLAVYAAESGDLLTGSRLVENVCGVTGNAFQRAWNFGYRNIGSLPSDADLRDVQRALGHGYAALTLEARLATKVGKNSNYLKNKARNLVLVRVLYFLVTGTLIAVAGLAFIVYLGLHRTSLVSLPCLNLSGRVLAIILLGWFLTLLVCSSLVEIVTNILPRFKHVVLTASYCLHAMLGTTYLCWAEGVTFGALWKRMTHGQYLKAVASGFGFFSLILVVTFAISLVVGVWPHNARLAQNVVAESLFSPGRSLCSNVFLFIVAVIVAPIFEELIFRGVLLSWLSGCRHLNTKFGVRFGNLTAVIITSVAFGLAHMQFFGFPFFAVMGVILSFAFMHGGNLAVAIVAHSFWNAVVFVSIGILI